MKNLSCRTCSAFCGFFRGGIFLLFLILMIHFWFIEGLFVPYRVESFSMSPTFTGPQWELTCPECEMRFHVNTLGQMPVYAICPRCCFAEIASSSGKPCRGTRLFVRKDNVGIQPAKRFDTILFRHPERSQERVVKRIVGLPGETVSFEGGNLFVDGNICHKPLVVQKQLREEVLHGHWQPEKNHDLVFIPEKPIPHTRPLFWDDEDKPVLYTRGISNESSENQWFQHDTAQTHLMDELMLEADWTGTPEKPFSLEVYEKITIRFHADEQTMGYDVLGNGLSDREKKSGPNRLGKSRSPIKILISLFDRHLLIALDEHVVYCEPIRGEAFETGAIPFRIRSGVVRNPVVYKDIYYTARPDSWTGDSHLTDMTVPEGCYFCIGDNCRFSEDSRVWKEPFLSKKNVIGPVFMHLDTSNKPQGRTVTPLHRISTNL